MKRYLAFIFTFIFIPGLLVAEAYAAGSAAHHEAPRLGTLIWPAINFAIYFSILTYAYKKLISPSLVGKEASIREEIESAKSELLQAKSALETIENRKECVESEKEEIELRISKEGKMQASLILEDANSQSAKIARDIQLRIDREFTKVKSGIRAEIVKRALNSAELDLKKSLSESQDNELRKDTLRSVLS